MSLFFEDDDMVMLVNVGIIIIIIELSSLISRRTRLDKRPVLVLVLVRRP